MQGLSKQRALAELRAKIETLEKRPPLAETSALAVDSNSFLANPAGILHEIFADEPRDAAAPLGFALAQARGLLGKERPAIIMLQLSADGHELGVPYGLGLVSFGIDPDAIVLARMDDPIDLLWAMEEAIACRAVAAVIADIATPIRALDFTASRRLSLRGAASGCSAFLIRYGRDREASAARFRWRLSSLLSQPPPFDAQAPGRPRWQVTLEKGSLGGRRVITAPEGEIFLVDWTERGFERVAADDRSRGARRPAPLFGALPAALGDGLSQAS
jgi:protein ImuA